VQRGAVWCAVYCMAHSRSSLVFQYLCTYRPVRLAVCAPHHVFFLDTALAVRLLLLHSFADPFWFAARSGSRAAWPPPAIRWAGPGTYNVSFKQHTVQLAFKDHRVTHEAADRTAGPGSHNVSFKQHTVQLVFKGHKVTHEAADRTRGWKGTPDIHELETHDTRALLAAFGPASVRKSAMAGVACTHLALAFCGARRKHFVRT
jgi:hypothetical protein